MTLPKKLPKSNVRSLAAARKRAGAPAESWRLGRNRLEKSELIRDALLQAAVEVVGEIGYADASIALITQRAGVAQGTFYNYFDSRQDILDKLLPALGKKMLVHIKKSALGGHSFSELEERSFRGFFSFLQQEPHFFRVLNEAESFAAAGHKAHFDTVSAQYLQFLQHSQKNGEFPGYRPEELDVVVFMLMSARSYLAMRYVSGDQQNELPDWVANTYMKFVRYGLEGVPPPDKKDDAAKE